MKLSFLLSFIGVLSVSMNSYTQSSKYSFSMKNVSIEDVLEIIGKQGDYYVIYDNSRDKLKTLINLEVKEEKIDKILFEILQTTGLSYQIIDNYIVITTKEESNTPVEKHMLHKISGRVTDNNDAPLAGVSVKINGTNKGAISDVNGNFSIDISDSIPAILTFSSVGFLTEEIDIRHQNTVNLKLVEDIKELDEVVVIGYGVQKKISVTAAISNVSTKDLIQSPVANISNSLIGRSAGLIAVQRSGEPGYDQSTLYIRGISTLNGADPLILIDGVERNNINLLDPNEIESINILKDASATAVFGVRGANGVIIITTKTGAKGKPRFSFTSNIATQSVMKIPDLCNAYEWTLLKNEALANDGKQLIFSDKDIEKFRNHSDPIFYPDVNWFEKLLKPYSFQQQYNLNITGGSDIIKHFISMGYFDQNGLYNNEHFNNGFTANPRYRRYNFRSNFDIQVTKRLSTSIKFGAQFAQLNFPNKSASEIFYSVLQANPISSPGLIDGKLIDGYLIDPIQGSTGRNTNPLMGLLSNGYVDNFNSTLAANIGFNYTMDFITRGLSFRGMITYDNYYSHNITRTKPVDKYKIYKSPTGSLQPIFVRTSVEGPFGFSENSGKNRTVYAEVAFDYSHTFRGHSISGLLLYNQRKYYSPTLTYNVPNGLLGIVGRITYNYKNRYLGEFNMGYNGSEQFAENKRFGFFPAYSAGWVITEEPFIHKGNYITFIKVRASYGECGNDKIGSSRFLYLPSVFSYTGTANGGYYFGEEGVNRQAYNGSTEGKIGNPDVTWERSKKINIGIDLKFFSDNLSFTSNYFIERRFNILITLGTVSALVGATLPAANLGKVENKGFEFESQWRHHFGRLNYWIKTNYLFARNKIIFKDEVIAQYPWMMETGYPIGQFKGLRFAGFFNTSEELNARPTSSYGDSDIKLGDMKYVDINGDHIIDNKDMVPTGYSTTPEVVFGLSFGGEFKAWDFSVLFQGADHVSSRLTETAAWPFDQNTRQAQKWHLGRWTQERYDAGEKISFPRLSEGGVITNNKQSSDFWIINSKYIRLKNLEIGYRFKNNLLKRLGIEYLRMFANGNNLITWSPMRTYDPEAPSGRGEFYPQVRTMNAGLNLKF